MSQISTSPTLYLKFLNLVRALDKAPTFPSLDATEERLLGQLANAWAAEKRVTVVEAMGMDAAVSSTTIHRRLKTLRSKGVICLEVDGADNRIKYVMPTPLATEYFATLSRCMVAATSEAIAAQ
jgi:DNA-binding MarR family transcriptional regulator